ncbi:MAG TPA: DinB family protein [Bryobacteraceae bacterium]|nr:DinB family protein [Bryobacteraceae bacterium]
MSIYGAAQLAASFQTVRKNTIQIAEEIPEEQYGFAAAEGVRPVAKLLVHIAVAPRVWQALTQPGVTTLVGFDFPTLLGQMLAEEEKPRSKDQILALLRSEGESFTAYLSGQEDGPLAEQVLQGDGQSYKTRLEILLSPKEHEMHHRGQLMLIERMLGITPHMTRHMQERMAQMRAQA